MSAISDAWAKLAAALGLNKATLAAATTAVNAGKTSAAKIVELQGQVTNLQTALDAVNAQALAVAKSMDDASAALAADMAALNAVLKP